LKSTSSPELIAHLIHSFFEYENEAIEVDRRQARQRRRQRATIKQKPRRTFPSYHTKRHNFTMARLRKKWAAAVNHLAPFIVDGSTEGLVCRPTRIDMSAGETKLCCRRRNQYTNIVPFICWVRLERGRGSRDYVHHHYCRSSNIFWSYFT
jgi:hypothetical protein